jgi:UPF0176 protein
MHRFLNIAAYRFVPLPDAAELRARLRESAMTHQLRGTILLAGEGINLVLAGEEAALRAWLKLLQADPRFAAMPVKESFSAALPFKRLKCKLKAEIIRMNDAQIAPASDGEGRAPALDAATLKVWLDQGCDDQGRPLLLLDTRNGFEVDEGAFKGALDWRLARFSDFPQALAQHRAELEGKTIVTYCTGGIRCEKAALLMRREGLQHTWQLDGGILQYFAQTVPSGGQAPHFSGACFVFDERLALDADLAERPPRAAR